MGGCGAFAFSFRINAKRLINPGDQKHPLRGASLLRPPTTRLPGPAMPSFRRIPTNTGSHSSGAILSSLVIPHGRVP